MNCDAPALRALYAPLPTDDLQQLRRSFVQDRTRDGLTADGLACIALQLEVIDALLDARAAAERWHRRHRR